MDTITAEVRRREARQSVDRSMVAASDARRRAKDTKDAEAEKHHQFLHDKGKAIQELQPSIDKEVARIAKLISRERWIHEGESVTFRRTSKLQLRRPVHAVLHLARVEIDKEFPPMHYDVYLRSDGCLRVKPLTLWRSSEWSISGDYFYTVDKVFDEGGRSDYEAILGFLQGYLA